MYEVALFLRHKRSTSLDGEQAFDLGDAIHNVPEFIQLSSWSEAEFREIYLLPYDNRWSMTDGFSLIETLERYHRNPHKPSWA